MNRFDGFVFAFMLVGAMLAVACGGSSKKSSSATSGSSSSASAGSSTSGSSSSAAAAAASPTVAPSPTQAPPQQIVLTTSENGAVYAFDKPQLTAKAGTITVHLTNGQGSARKHNFTLKSLDGNSDLAKTMDLAAGDSADVTFTVTQPGTYAFICSLPGHADRGAKGTLTIS